MNNRKGFTLIELLVVVLIIGILASVAIPQYFKVVERSRLSGPNSIFGGIASAQESNLVRLGRYTGSWAELDQTFTGTGTTPGDCATYGTGACEMGLFSFVITPNGTGDAYTITATRIAPLSGRYNDYVLTYTVPGNIITCSTTNCQDELL